jgi:hypothetical protein
MPLKLASDVDCAHGAPRLEHRRVGLHGRRFVQRPEHQIDVDIQVQPGTRSNARSNELRKALFLGRQRVLARWKIE